MSTNDPAMVWHRVAEIGEWRRARATVQPAPGDRDRRRGDRYGALDNRCRSGRSARRGFDRDGMLRCRWHGYDYDPLRRPTPTFDDAPSCFAVEVRDGGVYVGLAPEAEHVRTVSDLLVETMVEWGVTHVFGMVGHSNLGFADAMRRQEDAGRLTYIGIRHEGAAAFAAGAYGKLTGRPAACFGIAGPGSTNLLTGLYDAKVDRAPVLAISGQVPSKVVGRGAFQDLDLTAAFADVAGFSSTLNAQSDPAEMMALALKHARLEREVAHLVLPDEVQVLPWPERSSPARPAGRLADLATRAAGGRAGGGPRAAARRAAPGDRGGPRCPVPRGRGIALAERLGAPVITTFKAKGLISDAHRWPAACWDAAARRWRAG